MKSPRNGVEIWTLRSEALRSSMLDSGAGYPKQIAEVVNILETGAALSRLALPASARVLDGGAGGGRWSRAFAQTAHQVVVIEPSEIYETLCERMAAFKNVLCLKESFQDFHSDEPFDLIVVSGLLMYLTDDREASRFLHKVSALLKSECFLVLREPVVRRGRVVVDWVHRLKTMRGYTGPVSTGRFFDRRSSMLTRARN